MNDDNKVAVSPSVPLNCSTARLKSAERLMLEQILRKLKPIADKDNVPYSWELEYPDYIALQTFLYLS